MPPSTNTTPPSEAQPGTIVVTPPPDQLTSAERVIVLALVHAIGLRAARKALGVGAWTLDRLAYLWCNKQPFYRLRPSIVRRVRERLAARDPRPANDCGADR